MGRSDLISTLSLTFVLSLVFSASACKKSSDTLEWPVAPNNSSSGTVERPVATNKSTTEIPREKVTNIGKTLSAQIAMDTLFEVVGKGEESRYIWKNIDAPPDAAKNRLIPINQGSNGEVWVLGFKELDPDHAILVTGLTPLYAGEPNNCQACSGLASTFFFSRTENKDWILASVELDVYHSGNFGGTGTFSFVELGPGRPGFLFESGGTWQGYSTDSIDVFEIGKDYKTIPRTKEPILIYAQHACEEPEPSEDCFSVEGEWKFVPGPIANAFDLVIKFDGYVTEQITGYQEIHEQARYRVDGKSFVLVEGRNPVPGV